VADASCSSSCSSDASSAAAAPSSIGAPSVTIGTVFTATVGSAISWLNEDLVYANTNANIGGTAEWAWLYSDGQGTGYTDLSSGWFKPLASLTETEKYLYTSTGDVSGDNPNYDPTVLRVDRVISYGDGITKAVAVQNGYTGPMRSIPMDVVASIYRKAYWGRVRADDLPLAIRYPMFDAAVNSGTKQAIIWLQRALNTTVDGIIGPQTIAAARNANAPELAGKLTGHRLSMLAGLKHFDQFGRGWSKRIASVLMAG
jgi:hypothetical protein